MQPTAPEDVIARWWQRPDIFVREVFGATPDPWQDDVLRAFPTSPRIAMKASKGPGKTATLAWCCWNYLTTRPHPNIAATAINGANLRANLWKEMASWQNRSPLLLDQFEITSTQIVHRKHRRTWTMDARTWSKSADKEQIGNTLAGLHAPYLLFVLDESGAMPPEILDSAEGGFASSSQECHILQAGNTNSLQGALYYACVKHKDQWLVVPINGDPDNPKRSSRVSLEWAKEQIKAHGRNNPFIKVSILGEWPAQSFNALIGPDELEAATKRFYREYEIGGAARVLGVDVARYGTAASVICPRQGLQCFPMTTLRGVSSIQGAGAVARKWNEWNADACFIDMTGGFGSGWFDQLQQLGKTPIGVTYSGEAHNPSRYYNKRAEMYFDAVEWIKRGGALPDDCPELLATLAETNYTFAGERLILEPKEDIEERLGYSLDHADAFCFPAGTMVATPAGAVPIEQIQEGQRVLTPFGTALVGKTWAHDATELATVQFSNGTKLTGTPNHGVFVFARGRICIDSLVQTMAISPLSRRILWLLASTLFTGATNIGFKRAAAILPAGTQSTASAFCIAASGLTTMAQSRRDTRSTILIRIGEIARSTISRFLRRLTIVPNTLRTEAVTLASVEYPTKPGERRPNGTPLTKGWLGTLSTERLLGMGGSHAAPYAPSVVDHTGPIFQQERDIAQGPVEARLNISAARRTFARAIGAVLHSLLTAAGLKPVVPLHVRTENVLPTRVYNLTLDRDNAYYANGVLVFNCQTHAEPVSPRNAARIHGARQSKALADYDGFKEYFDKQ